MIDVYNIIGPQLKAWRADYMKLSQSQLGEFLGRSSRYVRDQEKRKGRVDTIVARACRDIEIQRSVQIAIDALDNAAFDLHRLYGVKP